MKALIPMLEGCGVESVVVFIFVFFIITRLAFCVRRTLLLVVVTRVTTVVSLFPICLLLEMVLILMKP